LPVVESTCDLGIIVSCDSSPCDIVAKAHKRAAAIHRTFVSRNIHLLLRAFTVYVRPLLGHDSVIWCPFTVHDIEAVESVQRRLTKRLPAGLNGLSYPERLKHVNLDSLELRRLYTDLYYCYKMLFGLVDVQVADFFEWTPHHSTIEAITLNCTGKDVLRLSDQPFFSERVVNVWNNLPASVDFKPLSSFKRTVKLVDFSKFLVF